MRVKLLVGLVGADFALSPGDHFICDAAEAQRLIQAGFAVADEPQVERAVKRVPEKRKK